MSTMTQLAIVTNGCINIRQTSKRLCFSFHIDGQKFTGRTDIIRIINRRKSCFSVTCSTAKPSSSNEIRYSFFVDKRSRVRVWALAHSVGVPLGRRVAGAIFCGVDNGRCQKTPGSSARIRSEVLTPFRSVRMFFYIAFIAQASLGGLIATTQLIGALANPSRADAVVDIAKGLGIDIGAAALFAFLYYRENKIKNAQMARLSREENLSNLKLRVDEKKIITVGEFRGLARLVILAGPSAFINEAFKLSETFTEQLIERGVLVVPFSTDGNELNFEFDESEDVKQLTNKRRRLWQLKPVLTPDWSEWLDDQKKLANVSPESPVYLSLRLDGRVRGSGVGYPPWNAFVAQLPPVKGMWSGLLDGMDGRVL